MPTPPFCPRNRPKFRICSDFPVAWALGFENDALCRLARLSPSTKAGSEAGSLFRTDNGNGN